VKDVVVDVLIVQCTRLEAEVASIATGEKYPPNFETTKASPIVTPCPSTGVPL
jgi:hypothetical protein